MPKSSAKPENTKAIPARPEKTPKKTWGITVPDETAVLPNTATEALAAWDEGKMLRAVRVTTDGATQNEIYAAAFDMIRAGNVVASARELPEHKTLTLREHQSAHSIAFVAMREGFSVMVNGHISAKSPEISVRKPEHLAQ
jgi:hypothetical protein